MSHETHNDAATERSKSQVAFTSSFWLIIILVGLFIAALNFINVMGHHGEEGKAEATEMHHATHEGGEGHEATEHHSEGEAKEGAKAAETEEGNKENRNMDPKHAVEKPAAEPTAPEHK